MKKIGYRLFLFILVGILIIPGLTQVGHFLVIEIKTEGSGDILKITNQVNNNGAMVWNGTEWVVNNTWAHSFFVDTRTGNRLKEYNSQIYQGTSPTGLIDPFGELYDYPEISIPTGNRPKPGTRSAHSLMKRWNMSSMIPLPAKTSSFVPGVRETGSMRPFLTFTSRMM